MRYFKNTATGRGCAGNREPDGDNYVEITIVEWQALVKDFQKELLEKSKEEQPQLSKEEMNFDGLKIDCYTDYQEGNIIITDPYIIQYNEELELIEFGELDSTTIAKGQYKELLKLRNQWRKS